MCDADWGVPYGPPTYSNVTEEEDLYLQLKNSFEDMRNILFRHCGPYASTALIGQAGRMVDQVDVFTKDGISIARALLADHAPIARFTGRISRFLGASTDQRCHDGTTTVMALFASLMTEYFHVVSNSDLREDLEGRLAGCVDADWKRFPMKDRNRLVRDMKTIIARSQDLIKSATISTEMLHERLAQNADCSEAEVRKALAYQIALTASKGDRELSLAIAEVATAMPIEMHGLFVKAVAPDEECDRVRVVKRDFQFEARCRIAGDVMNVDMRQAFVSDNCVLMGATKTLTMNGWDETILIDFFSSSAKSEHALAKMGMKSWWDIHDGRHLILFVPGINSATLFDRINQFNVNHPNNPIVVAESNIDSKMSTYVVSCLYALRGLPVPEDMEPENTWDMFLENVSVVYRRGSLQIKGLYEHTDSPTNPLYDNPEASLAYTTTRETCERLIKQHVQDPKRSGMNEYGINTAIYYYRFLCCQKIMDVEIGGLLHGNKELQSVYEDAMGSALSVLGHGFVCDVFGKLLFHVQNITQEFPLLHHIWREALSKLLKNIHQIDDNDIFYTTYSDLYRSIISDPVAQTTYWADLLDADTSRKFLAMENAQPIALLQPAVGAHEQIRRIGDILPSVMNTTTFIDMGHIVDVEHRNNQP